MLAMKIGIVRKLVVYPVKSMAGVPAQSLQLGWHGFSGDRRFAFRKIGDGSGFPWLTASQVPQLLLHQPFCVDEHDGEFSATHVRTPNERELKIGSEELDSHISDLAGSRVEAMHLKHGVFDQAAVSIISLGTISAISEAAKVEPDIRRFRANFLVEVDSTQMFEEDDWVGGMLVFGEGDNAPAICVTERDIRCVMINIDPNTGKKDSTVMKTVLSLNENCAGVYGTVVRTGEVQVGDQVSIVNV